MEMFKTITKAWKIIDIRKKIIFTLLMLVLSLIHISWIKRHDGFYF